MQLKFFAVAAALAGAATAQLENLPSSVLQVLITAIPPDVVQSFNSNPTQVFNDIASSVSAGTPPSWYTALPSDVQSALNSFAAGQAPSAPTPSATGGDVSSAASSVAASVSASLSSEISSAASSIVNSLSSAASSDASASMASTASGSESASSSGSATDASATASSTGGAAIPTGVIGAGVAGLLGLAGVLAL